MNEDEIARGVARGLHEHQRRQADAQIRSMLSGLLLMAIGVIAFILLIRYG
ncbi:hypothetical protein ID875_21155 [Streptomyces globisporus]|uniref:Uncharacterized protein n=1 Tax=Streptomyces globisporus TaxID=1908 RepID=A0A927GPF1_STRGL|nr:hypothetical protein [Streptomyces globisporus]